MTHVYETWLIYMRHDSYIWDILHRMHPLSRVVWIIRDWIILMRHDSFIRDMTHIYETWLISVRHDSQDAFTQSRRVNHSHVPWLMYISVNRTGWQRPIGRLISWITFRKLATNYRALLRKMTYKDKASCESSPPCTRETHGLHVWMGRVNRTRLTRDIWMSHGTHINQFCHTSEWVMSWLTRDILWMRHVTNGYMWILCVPWLWFICVPWLIHMSRVSRVRFTRPIHTCKPYVSRVQGGEDS